MKTDELVTMLATGAGAVEANIAGRRYATAISLGSAAAMLLMVMLLGLRADLQEAIYLPKFWIKFGFVACLAAASLLLTLRLSRPGSPIGNAPVGLMAPVFAMWAIAAAVLFNADPVERVRLFLGNTWAVCPFLIAMLSVPIFVAVVWATKGLAPTQLRLAGAAAGLLSGTTGALVYCLHCPEMEAPFLGVWYLIGMLIPAAIGALSGRFLLRW